MNGIQGFLPVLHNTYATGLNTKTGAVLNSAQATNNNLKVNDSVALQTQSAKPIAVPNESRSDSLSNSSVLSQEALNQDNQSSSLSLDKNTSREREQAKQEQSIQQVIAQLKARDTEVKAHEMAHLTAAGGYSTGGMSFTYQTGPDGKRYAIGGEVGIDVSPIQGDPQATLQKAMVIQRAALAPAEPSSQDLKVAQAASQMMVQARIEIASANTEEKKESGKQDDGEIDEMASADNSGDKIVSNESDDSHLITPQRQQFDLRMQLSPFSVRG